MALVNITEAARLAGKSRSQFYKGYIKAGKVSVSKDAEGKPCIDTAELLRVFGRLQDTGDTGKQDAPAHAPTPTPQQADTGKLAAMELEVKLLREQLEKAEGREKWLQGQVENLTDTMKRLEAPKNKPVKWKFWE